MIQYHAVLCFIDYANKEIELFSFQYKSTSVKHKLPKVNMSLWYCNGVKVIRIFFWQTINYT